MEPEDPETDPGSPADPQGSLGEKDPAVDDPAQADGEPAWLVPALVGGVCALGVASAAVLARLHRRQRLARGDWAFAWRALCRDARRRGLSWKPSATEDQVADVIAVRLGDGRLAADVRRVARNACLARYGRPGAAVAPAAVDLNVLLASVFRALARKGRPDGTEPTHGTPTPKQKAGAGDKNVAPRRP